MTEPAVLQLTEGDLGDSLDPDRHPRQILAGVPSALRARQPACGMSLRLGPVAPRVPVERVRQQGRQLVQQLSATLHREAGSDTDVMQPTFVVVQAQQQRADPLAILVNPVAGHRAIGRAFVLHLDQGALVRRVRIAEALGDDAVQTGTLELDEPSLRRCVIGGAGAHVDRRVGVGEQRLQSGMALFQRCGQQQFVVDGQQVEGHERGGRLGSQTPHSRFGRMNALQQCVEVETAIVGVGHHDLAVDHAAIRQVVQHRLDQLGEVARERALVAAGQFDVVAIAEHDAAKAIPLGLVQPTVAIGNGVGQLGQHRREGGCDRQRHGCSLPGNCSRADA